MADGGYRDERETLRARVEELQAEIKAMRAEARRPPAMPVGPAKKCRACGQSQVIVERWSRDNTPKKLGPALRNPRACTPTHRIRFGWFRKCRESGEHLHEECRVCDAKWLSAFAEVNR